jgi:hypothetical protein
VLRLALVLLLQVLVLDHLDVERLHGALPLRAVPVDAPVRAAGMGDPADRLGHGPVDGPVQQHAGHAHERLHGDDVRTDLLLRLLAPREGYEYGMRPTVPRMGIPWFITYAGALILLHHFWLFNVEVFRFDRFFSTFLRALLSALFTLSLAILVQFLTTRPERGRA